MKKLGSLTLGLLLAITAFHCNTAVAATTSELLQQGLYAEEVEGNIDSAIKLYGQVIKNGSAQPNQIAQALYRQGVCYMKLKDEPAARAALEKLVTDYPSQTELVEKARPLLDDLTDFDPAALMPAGTLAYMEFGSPGRQIETLVTMLKGTPFENPLAAMGTPQTGNANQKSPADLVGALLNPSMMAEFKKIRSSAVGIIGMAENHPQMISVLYPGKSDALRGLIQAGLGMAGKPGDAIEGLQRVNLPEDMAVAYDDRVLIMARPASQLLWCVKQYKGMISEPTLVSGNKSFAKLSKAQRQKNALTVWANVDEAYAQMFKLFPANKIPKDIQSANTIVDFSNIDELTLTHSVEANGIVANLNLQFKDGHHCLLYDLIRTPNLSKAALEAVPAEAIAVASFALGQADSAQASRVRAKIQNVTGLDIGREIFANIEQVTIFALPTGENGPPNKVLPATLGLAITSRNPEQTRQVLTTLLGTASTLSFGANNAKPGQYQIGVNGKENLYCHVEQVNGTTLVSLNRAVIDASAKALQQRQSVCTSGPLNSVVSKLSPNSSKVMLVNAGGAIRLAAPQMNFGKLDEAQAKQVQESLDQLARATDATTIQLRTDERPDNFTANTAILGIPPLERIIEPLTQIQRISGEARAQALATELRQQKPATMLHAAAAPVIDGNEDAVWASATRYKLDNVIESLGSGEKPSPVSSPDDLSADFRALWDENNLYLLVDVTDDKLVADTVPDQPVVVPSGSSTVPWWYDDSVEIYLDADNAKASEYGQHDAQIRFNWNATKPTMRIYNQNKEIHLEGIEFAMAPTANGYRLETKLPWRTFAAEPKIGARIGLDIHVNDDDDGGSRDTKITWRDQRDTAWQSPQAFGNAELAGLIGWWKFDEAEGKTAHDSSDGNHSGTLVGNAKWARGRLGGALQLDGHDSFVRIADKSAFDMAGEMTIACWVNIHSVPAEWMAIVTKGDNSWRLSTLSRDHKFHFSVNDWSRVSVNGSTDFKAGAWHHVVAVHDGRDIRLYLDGKLDATQPWTDGIGQNNADVLIGENAEQTGRCFDGLIDDLRIYNYALSENEIKALAASQIARQ